jgi:drug/metabolite transporter (DMT)-like permease
MFLRYLLLFLGVLACSTSAVFIRASSTDPLVLSACRLVIAFVLLTPLLLVQLRRHRGAFTAAHLRRTRVPSLVLACHLITWTLGARMTAIAQATLIVNLVPIALPFFLLLARPGADQPAEVAGRSSRSWGS